MGAGPGVPGHGGRWCGCHDSLAELNRRRFVRPLVKLKQGRRGQGGHGVLGHQLNLVDLGEVDLLETSWAFLVVLLFTKK